MACTPDSMIHKKLLFIAVLFILFSNALSAVTAGHIYLYTTYISAMSYLYLKCNYRCLDLLEN